MADLNVRPEDWPSISRRLDEALALAPADQARWLETIDEPDDIKSTLGRLLAGSPGVETGDFLGELPKLTISAGPAPGADAAHAARAGTHVGPYRLLAELGRGGMGTVWLAERVDGQPRRKVALKLPHLGWAPGLVERLGRERDILASLEHPNIARLYDAGSDALGRPYLALEYVDGTPIDRYCQANKLPLRERLRLLLRVAAAVAYAHTRLVVHRDLKPSNILVTKDGDVRLLDFGIARLLADDATGELTRAGAEALTPEYASPEQIRGGAIGTQSDIYSLGVVAYELIAGRRPYVLEGRRSVAALAEAIATTDVPLASRATDDPALRRSLAGDLDAILNKALKKDVGERYATVEAFAEDIERHLTHAPVLARPDTFTYRARKFVARNALPVAAAGAVLIAVVGGVAVALWQAREAHHEAARAEQVKDFALSLFDAADTGAGAGAETTATELLLAAQKRVEKELGDRPEMAVELMTAIGFSLLGQGKTAEAEPLLARAVEIGGRTLDPRSPRLLSARVAYGEALFVVGKAQEAATILSSAADEARRQGSAHDLMTAQRFLSGARNDLGDMTGGVEAARAAVAVIDSPLGPRVRKLDAAEAWISLSHTLGFAGKPGQTEAARKGLAIAREIYGNELAEPVIAGRRALATGLASEGRLADAIVELKGVRDDWVRLVGPKHPNVVFAYQFLGRAQLDAGLYEDAIGTFSLAVGILAGGPQAGGRGQAIQEVNLAIALTGARRYEEALSHYDRSQALFVKLGSDPEGYLPRLHSARALTLVNLGRLDEAERAFNDVASSDLTGAAGAIHRLRIAVLRDRQHRPAEAVELVRSGLAGLTPAVPKGARAGADLMAGTTLLDSNRASEAVEPLREAVRLFAEQQLVMSPERNEASAALSRAESAIGVAPASAPVR